MDAEKDGPTPEKSTHDQGDSTKTDEDQNGEKGKGIEFNKVSSAKSFSKAASKPEQIDIESNPIEEEQEQEKEGEANTQEPSPAPPDLAKVSEEIDQFISSLFKTQHDEKSIAPPDLPICVEQFVVLVEAKIEEYDYGESPVKWSKLTEEEAASFLEIVNRISSLSEALLKFASEYKYAGSLNRVGGVLQRTMSYLEEELKVLLEDCNSDNNNNNNNNNRKSDVKTPLKQSSLLKDQEPASLDNPIPHQKEQLSGEENTISGYSESILSDLNKLSNAMIAGGYETECCHVYFVARRNALEDDLAKLGFEKHSIDELHRMQWESLEKEIETWLRTFKECTAVHFSRERKLCDTVFKDNPSLSESLFGGLCRGLLFQILNFAGAVALTKRSVDKLFKYIAIYEALREILPSMDKLFSDESLVELKSEAAMIRSRLGETMILTLGDFESFIKADLAKNHVSGGAVHPLNIHVMDYLENVCEHSTTLDQIFNEHQRIEPSDSTTGGEPHKSTLAEKNKPDGKEEAKNSPFQEQIIIIMDLLDANIEGKAKHYKDTSLSSIFMMNNGRYMLKKIRGCAELNALMGDTWYRKKSSDLRQYHKGYQRDTWGKLLNCFTPDGLTSHGKVVKPVLKERFKSFNALFDEIHKTQSNWVVGDEQLQSELRVSISNTVVPAYRSFLGRYSPTFTPGRQTEKYVKYQPEDIETYIDELFDGTAAPMGRKKL